jgi:hypothetical protein
VEQHELELVAEGVGLEVVDEVTVAFTPGGDGVDHTVDDLAERRLALGRTERAAEVLLGDDVGRVLRPRDRELDVGLVEGVGAVLVVGDARLAPLPLDGVVGMHLGRGEVPADPDAHLVLRHDHGALPLQDGDAQRRRDCPRSSNGP